MLRAALQDEAWFATGAWDAAGLAPPGIVRGA
jgi:hypothetical protein